VRHNPGAVVAQVMLALGTAAVVEPVLLERWNERLLFNAGDRSLGTDISFLTRKAEADAIWKILGYDPIHFVHGRGIGSTYHWEPA
jgi:hypothetical protein